MSDGTEHGARVDAWLQAVPRELPLEQLLPRFERVMSAVLRRAHQTLGEVTLTAILDRVLYVAAEKFPLVAWLEADASGIRCRALRERTSEQEHAQVVESLRFVFVEFLTVFGNLTAEILTPALHAEITRDQQAASEAAASGGPARHERKDDKGVKS